VGQLDGASPRGTDLSLLIDDEELRGARNG